MGESYKTLAKELSGKYASLDAKVADAIAYTHHAMAAKNADALAAAYHGIKGGKQNPEVVAQQAQAVLGHTAEFLQARGEKLSAQDWLHASALTSAMYQHLKSAGLDESSPIMQAYKQFDSEASTAAKGYLKTKEGRAREGTAKAGLKKAYGPEQKEEKHETEQPLDPGLFPDKLSLEEYFKRVGAPEGPARDMYNFGEAHKAQMAAEKPQGSDGGMEKLMEEQYATAKKISDDATVAQLERQQKKLAVDAVKQQLKMEKDALKQGVAYAKTKAKKAAGSGETEEGIDAGTSGAGGA